MSESFDLLSANNLVAGAVGEPGERIFFLQGSDDTTLVSLKLEKTQIQALASGIEEILDSAEDDSAHQRPTELVEPVMAAWTVAGLGIAVDEDRERLVVIAEELLDDDDDDEQTDSATCRFHISFAQARGFAAQALLLVEYGRDFGRQNGHRPH